MLIGLHTLPFDPQGRLSLPDSFRRSLGGRAYLTQGFDCNLMLLGEQAFARLCDGLKGTSLTDPAGRQLARLLLGSAVELELGEDGNVQLPENLKTFAGLDGQGILLGQGEFAEIWAPAAWERQASLLGDGEANAERFSRFQLSLA
jgi:MraZ protein